MKKLLIIFVSLMMFTSYSSAKSLKKTVKYEVIEATASKVNNLGAPETFAAVIKIGKEYYRANLDAKYESPSLIIFIEDQKQADIIYKQNKKTNKLFKKK